MTKMMIQETTILPRESFLSYENSPKLDIVGNTVAVLYTYYFYIAENCTTVLPLVDEQRRMHFCA